MRHIVEIQLMDLRSRLEKEHGIILTLTDQAMDFLAERGFEPLYGARPLKRLIQRMLQNKLATAILSGDLLPGSSVSVDVKGGDIILVG